MQFFKGLILVSGVLAPLASAWRINAYVGTRSVGFTQDFNKWETVSGDHVGAGSNMPCSDAIAVHLKTHTQGDMTINIPAHSTQLYPVSGGFTAFMVVHNPH